MRCQHKRLDHVVGYARTVLLVALYCTEVGIMPHIDTLITQSIQRARVISLSINDKINMLRCCLLVM